MPSSPNRFRKNPPSYKSNPQQDQAPPAEGPRANEDAEIEEKLDKLFGKLYKYDAHEKKLKKYQPDKKHQDYADDSRNTSKWLQRGHWNGKYEMHDANWSYRDKGKFPTTWGEADWTSRLSTWSTTI